MIFVTGGTGLLGSQLLYDLALSNTPIRAIYRSEERLGRVRRFFLYRNPQNGIALYEKIEWIKGDILDIANLLEQMEGCQKVYHCAGLVSFHPDDYSKLFKINREGTANIVNACLEKNIHKLCHVSSTAAIGGDSKELITEKTKWKNGAISSGYSLSKNAAEREVWRGIEEGLNAVIINPCVIFGPGSWEESSLAIFSTVEKGLSHYPPGSNATVDVRNVSSCMISLMESDISAQRFLCTGSNQTFKELTTEISVQLRIKPPQKEAARWQVIIVRLLLSFVKGIAGKRSNITKETVKNLFSDKAYDPTKIKQAISIEFIPLKEQVSDAISGRLN